MGLFDTIRGKATVLGSELFGGGVEEDLGQAHRESLLMGE